MKEDANRKDFCPPLGEMHLTTESKFGWNLPRWLMTLTIVAVIFGVFAIGLILLLIYKSTLTMRRDDQLFLDDASSHMHAEQTELLAKVNRLNIPMRILSVGSGVFLLILAAMWIYQKLSAVE